MKVPAKFMVASAVLLGLPTALWSDEAVDHFDGASAKLYSAGYRQVHLVDSDLQLFSAYDDSGSEVMIVVDPADGNVLTVSYVHEADE